MTKIIKEVTLKEIKSVQDSGEKVIDINLMTINLQASIIINVAVGTGYSSKKVDWEDDNGVITQKSLSEVLVKLISQTIERNQIPINMLIPELIRYNISPWDRRYLRNVNRLRAVLQSMIDGRRSGQKESYLGDADLLSIMLSSDLFSKEDELIKDEIVTFFVAGFKTIQISTTNLIYYLHKHPEIKEKLLKEILPPVEAAKDNIVEKLDYDTVMEFEYLHQCYYESLRINPPLMMTV